MGASVPGDHGKTEKEYRSAFHGDRPITFSIPLHLLSSQIRSAFSGVYACLRVMFSRSLSSRAYVFCVYYTSISVLRLPALCCLSAQTLSEVPGWSRSLLSCNLTLCLPHPLLASHSTGGEWGWLDRSLFAGEYQRPQATWWLQRTRGRRLRSTRLSSTERPHSVQAVGQQREKEERTKGERSCVYYLLRLQVR